VLIHSTSMSVSTGINVDSYFVQVRNAKCLKMHKLSEVVFFIKQDQAYVDHRFFANYTEVCTVRELSDCCIF